jgi:hypothetical protein
MNIKDAINKIKLRHNYKYDKPYFFDFDLRFCKLYINCSKAILQDRNYLKTEEIIPTMKKPIFPGTKYYVSCCSTNKNMQLYIKCNHVGVGKNTKIVPLENMVEKLGGFKVNDNNTKFSIKINDLIKECKFMYRDIKSCKSFVYFEKDNIGGIVAFTDSDSNIVSLLPEFYK